jgi:hypothetical protein
MGPRFSSVALLQPPGLRSRCWKGPLRGVVARIRLFFFSGPRALWTERDKPALGRRMVAAVPSHLVNWEWHEADVFSRTGWTLDRRALVTTHGAAGTLP